MPRLYLSYLVFVFIIILQCYPKIGMWRFLSKLIGYFPLWKTPISGNTVTQRKQNFAKVVPNQSNEKL